MMHHKVTIIIKKKQASKQASAPPQEWYNSLPKKSLTQCVISWAEDEEQLNQTVILQSPFSSSSSSYSL
jgi:hypothetical protein